jgi:hypothetical protein
MFITCNWKQTSLSIKNRRHLEVLASPKLYLYMLAGRNRAVKWGRERRLVIDFQAGYLSAPPDFQEHVYKVVDVYCR